MKARQDKARSLGAPSGDPIVHGALGGLNGSALPFTRRQFLKTFTGGLAVLWLLDSNDARAQAESGSAGRGSGRGSSRRPPELAAWLHIAADGTVTAFTGKTEVGQNIRTSLTQAVAEELPVSLAAIKLIMADTTLVPWDGGTVGSRTTPDMNLQFRRVAATAREALLDLAAKTWAVDRGTLSASDGKVHHAASKRSIGFGELTKGEKPDFRSFPVSAGDTTQHVIRQKRHFRPDMWEPAVRRYNQDLVPVTADHP